MTIEKKFPKVCHQLGGENPRSQFNAAHRAGTNFLRMTFFQQIVSRNFHLTSFFFKEAMGARPVFYMRNFFRQELIDWKSFIIVGQRQGGATGDSFNYFYIHIYWCHYFEIFFDILTWCLFIGLDEKIKVQLSQNGFVFNFLSSCVKLDYILLAFPSIYFHSHSFIRSFTQ